MKALEVTIDGEVIGIYVPPKDASFAAMIGNIPRTYMRAHIMTGTESESWQWQLPDIKEGQVISFRMLEAQSGSGVPPQFVRKRDPKEIEKTKRLAQQAYKRAMEEKALREKATSDPKRPNRHRAKQK